MEKTQEEILLEQWLGKEQISSDEFLDLMKEIVLKSITRDGDTGTFSLLKGIDVILSKEQFTEKEKVFYATKFGQIPQEVLQMLYLTETISPEQNTNG